MAELDDQLNKPSEAETRITQLSGKLKETAEAKEKAEQEAATARKEADFYKTFSQISGKYQGATEHAEEIRAKVMQGYDPEDAAVAVLNKAGKLSPPAPAPAPVVETPSPAGGSASTTIPQGGEKPVAEMSQEERRKVLEKELIWQ